jgi:ABC-2 type transport system permease protein
MAAPVLLAIRLDEPWVLAASWAAVAAAALALYRRTLPLAGALLERRREQVLAAVTGDE